MNKKVKSIIRIISFALVLFLILSGTYKILSWKDTTGGYLSSSQQLYSTDNNLIDVAFVGTSHVYCGVYPSVLWEQYGYSAFDMSISGQDKNSAVHSIAELCKTQSPKIVFVDMYALIFDGYLIEGNLYRNALAFKTSSNSVALIKDIADQDKWKDFVTKWPIIHTRYSELDKYDYIQYEPSIYGRGECYCNNVASDACISADALSCSDITELSTENKKWLDELVQLSKDNNFRLVFFTIPFSETVDMQKVINGAKEYADQNDITFITLSQLVSDSDINLSNDFEDSNHLNRNGAYKLTSCLGQWLNSNCSLSDRRGDSAYELWDQDHTWYEHEMLAFDFDDASDDLAQTVSLISDADNLTTIISIEGNNLSECPDLYLDALSALGITASDLETGGKWKYEDGRLTKLMDNDITASPIVIQLSDTDFMQIQFTGQLSKDNILLNFESRNHAYTNLTLITYDRFLDEIVADIGLG